MDAGGTGRPVFDGVQALLTSIRELSRRPNFYTRGSEKGVRGDQPLPIICLQGTPVGNEFMDALNARLDEPDERQIPHVLVDVETAQESAKARWASGVHDFPLIPLLDELSAGISGKKIRGHRSLTQFNRYRLANWLTGQQLEPSEEKRGRAKIVQLLRAWVNRDPVVDPETTHDVVQAVPVGNVGVRAAIVACRFALSRWLSERVPGLRQERRWFMRQPFMVPQHSAGFLGFAERLTAGYRSSENDDQVRKLLVHAFLEDLRHKYRRPWFRAFPNRKGSRHTAYFVLLLQNVSEENGGWEFLTLLNAVRNETGEPDPLLVVASSDDQARLSAAFQATGPYAAANIESALARWRETLPTQRQLLAENARYLPIVLPAKTTAPADVHQLAPGDQNPVGRLR